MYRKGIKVVAKKFFHNNGGKMDIFVFIQFMIDIIFKWSYPIKKGPEGSLLDIEANIKSYYFFRSLNISSA
ncbi:MAG: hypothetical protein PWQ77_1884 [Kosmotogales bacterium]|nr:hypothetical protein [Kosmotogales bacterium]